MLNLLLIINLTSTCNVTKPGKCRYTTLQYNGPLLCICSYISKSSSMHVRNILQHVDIDQ